MVMAIIKAKAIATVNAMAMARVKAIATATATVKSGAITVIYPRGMSCGVA